MASRTLSLRDALLSRLEAVNFRRCTALLLRPSMKGASGLDGGRPTLIELSRNLSYLPPPSPLANTAYHCLTITRLLYHQTVLASITQRTLSVTAARTLYSPPASAFDFKINALGLSVWGGCFLRACLVCASHDAVLQQPTGHERR